MNDEDRVINDHASRIKQKREEQKESPEEKAIKELVANMVEKAMQQAFSNFVLHNGNAIKVSGSGRNITVAWEEPPGLRPAAIAVGAGLPEIPDDTKDYVLVYDHSDTTIKWVEITAC